MVGAKHRFGSVCFLGFGGFLTWRSRFHVVPEVKLNPTPFICVGAIEQATRVGSDARNDLRSYLDGIGMH